MQFRTHFLICELAIRDILGFAVGCIGMSYGDFCRCTPEEFESISQAWYKQQESLERDKWERTRILATISIQPHVKNKIKPAQLLPLPRDDKKENRPKQDQRPLSADEHMERFISKVQSLNATEEKEHTVSQHL